MINIIFGEAQAEWVKAEGDAAAAKAAAHAKANGHTAEGQAISAGMARIAAQDRARARF